MGYIIIDGLGQSTVSNPPNAQVLGNLWHYLKGWANLERNVVINGYGSALGPGEFEYWTPETVARFVRGGNVFIDWCEWPMFYQVQLDGATQQLGASGFQQFAQALGYDWLSNENFYAGIIPRDGYSMTHGYQERGAQNGLFLPTGSVEYAQQFSVYSYPAPLNAGGFASMMSLYHPGIGWYFYAAFSPFFNLSRVPHDVYGAFIGACLHHQTDQTITTPYGSFTVAYYPYQVVSPTLPHTTTGPTSPYRHPTTPQPSSTTTSPSTTTSSAPPSPNRVSGEEIAAGAALLGGATIMVAVLVSEKRRRQRG